MTDEQQYPKCSKCKHYKITDFKNILQGECRRFPPQHFLMPLNQGLADVTGFPVTKETSFCGEFSSKIIH